MKESEKKLMDLIQSISYTYDRRMRRDQKHIREMEDLPLTSENLRKLNQTHLQKDEEDPVLMDLGDDLKVIAATQLQKGYTDAYIKVGEIYDYIRSVRPDLRRPRLEKLIGIKYKKLVKLRFDSHQKTLGGVFTKLASLMGKGESETKKILKKQKKK